MSALSLVANAKPVFLSENYFNRHADNESDLVVTTGDTLKHRLYDMDPLAQWISTSSNDATQEVITAGFWLPGMQTSRQFDFIAILNHNLTNFSIEYSNNNGASWTTVHTVVAGTATNTIVSLSAAVTANKVRISMDSTITPNQDKLVGAIVFALATFQAADRPRKYVDMPVKIGHKTATMADGSIRRAYKFRSDASFTFVRWDLAWIVPDAGDEEARFDALAFNGLPFLFMPRPGDLTTLIKQCEIKPGTYKKPYLTLSTSGGRLIQMIIEEIGGA